MPRTIGSGRKVTWKTALTATPTTDIEGRGTIRIEAGPLGERKFVWVKVDQSGGCDLGDVLMYSMTIGGLTVSVAAGSGMTIFNSSALSFVEASAVDAADNDFVDDFIIITSALAGAAPELEMRKIKRNTSSRFYVTSDFSAKPITKDAFVVLRPFTVIDAVSQSSSKTGRPTQGVVAGVAMADASRNDYLWLQTWGVNEATKVDTDIMGINALAIIGPGAAAVSSILSADTASADVPEVPQNIGFFLTSVHDDLQAGETTNLTAPLFLKIS